ncbi:MAG: hypothetical protein GC179_30675 [Anaerolineaceae bacterium]|nr:hypothetical protein [Anaerolineaceae bacterium]
MPRKKKTEDDIQFMTTGLSLPRDTYKLLRDVSNARKDRRFEGSTDVGAVTISGIVQEAIEKVRPQLEKELKGAK